MYCVYVHTNHVYDEHDDDKMNLIQSFGDIESALRYISLFLNDNIFDFIENYAGQEEQKWCYPSCGNDGLLHNPSKEDDYLDAGISISLLREKPIEFEPINEANVIAFWAGSYRYYFDGEISFYNPLILSAWNNGLAISSSEKIQIQKWISAALL